MSALPQMLTGHASTTVALAIASAIAGGALAVKSLTRAGALAALMLGTVALRCSWSWGAFLIIWFVLASLLSRVGRQHKARAMRGLVVKGDRRDATQVLANGACFGVAALATMTAAPEPRAASLLAMAAVGALSAAGSDTWATELGTLGNSRPWSVRRRRRVPAGTSGAVSLIGTLAAVAGAFVLSALAAALGVIVRDGVLAAAAGGFAGAMADTLLGAWMQERRWCPSCDTGTEQHVHSCGTRTEAGGGVPAMDNDAVNFACTLVGGGVAAIAWAASH